MFRFAHGITLAALVTLAAGCGTNGDSSSPGTNGENGGPAEQVNATKLVLKSAPAGARGVLDIRKQAKDGDDVVVVGRVGGSTKPFTEGRASFLIVDPSLKPTEGCSTPWDFCEYAKKDVRAACLTVKFVDAEGKTLKSGARKLFGIKELSTVVVKGKARRDDKENLVVVASAIFVRPASDDKVTR